MLHDSPSSVAYIANIEDAECRPSTTFAPDPTEGYIKAESKHCENQRIFYHRFQLPGLASGTQVYDKIMKASADIPRYEETLGGQ